LLGITLVDPIEYDLIFERFYNKGRNSADHISLPDIDIDIPAHKRELIIQYVKDKYGIEHVSQMVTFGRLQGRSAIKEVFRVTETGSFSEINEITNHIPDEARISDQLEEMGDERSIIMWALLNNKNDLKDFCYVNSMGDLEGDYAPFFKKAIDLEGTFKTQGKHAAGVVVSKSKLRDVCPMVYPTEGDEQLCGFEMEHLEAAGLVKLDLLGLSLLDKLMYIKEI
jgi:DNA polymerase-3 subunit alpha